MNYSEYRYKTINGSVLPILGTVSAGTWAATTASDVLSYDKTSVADTAVLELALSSFMDYSAGGDTVIESITFNYTIGTAAVTSVAAELHPVSPNAETNVPTAGTAISLSGTYGKTAATHMFTVTPASDATFGVNDQMNIEFTITPVSETAYTFKLNFITVKFREIYN